jgi:hypothetical protein
MCLSLQASSHRWTAKLSAALTPGRQQQPYPVTRGALNITETNRTERSLFACRIGHLDPI